MKAELKHYLGYRENEKQHGGRNNYRNGTYSKKVKGNSEELEIEVPRDKEGSFNLQLDLKVGFLVRGDLTLGRIDHTMFLERIWHVSTLIHFFL